MNSNSEPTASDAPLPQALLDELNIVWRDRDWLDGDDTEDEMIARFRRWREWKHQHRFSQGPRTPPLVELSAALGEPVQAGKRPECSERMNLLPDSASKSVVAPEGTHQLREKLFKGARRRLRMHPTADDGAIWRNRLRSRPDTQALTSWRDRLRPRSIAVGTSRNTTRAANAQSGKPQGIDKSRKASTKKQLPATKRQAIISGTRKAHSSTRPDSNESSSQVISGNVTETRGASLRRRPRRLARPAQPQGVQKTRNANQRATTPTTSCKQRLLRLLTPPQSE